MYYYIVPSTKDSNVGSRNGRRCDLAKSQIICKSDDGASWTVREV